MTEILTYFGMLLVTAMGVGGLAVVLTPIFLAAGWID